MISMKKFSDNNKENETAAVMGGNLDDGVLGHTIVDAPGFQEQHVSAGIFRSVSTQKPCYTADDPSLCGFVAL
jgi:hypothetical protein